MSIILRALKKIQSQQLEQPSEGVERGDVLEIPSVGAPTLVEGMEPRHPEAVDTFLARSDSMEAHVGLSAMPEAMAARHRLGSVPKVLMGLIFALGVFATGWFGSGIYLSSRGETDSGDVSLQTTTGKQETLGESMPAQDSPEQPLARVANEAPVTSIKTAVGALQTSVQEPVAFTGEELPSARGGIAAQSRFSEGSAVGARSVESDGRRSAEKEAKPEGKGRPALKINAIAWRTDEPKAIVNMQRVFVGDMIEGATVKAIQRKSILFEYEGETFEVRF